MLAAELDTPDKRRRYVAHVLRAALLGRAGTVRARDVDVMTEPFGDADSFRASLGDYEYARRRRARAGAEEIFEPPDWIGGRY